MKTVLSQKRFINIPRALLSEYVGQILGLRSMLSKEHCQTFMDPWAVLRAIENVSAKIWTRDHDDGGDYDGNNKAATIYTALLCAKPCAKHFTFVISLKPHISPMR